MKKNTENCVRRLVAAARDLVRGGSRVHRSAFSFLPRRVVVRAITNAGSVDVITENRRVAAAAAVDNVDQ